MTVCHHFLKQLAFKEVTPFSWDIFSTNTMAYDSTDLDDDFMIMIVLANSAS